MPTVDNSRRPAERRRRATLTKRDERQIDRALGHFMGQRHLFTNLAQSLVGHLTADPDLGQLIHFIKWRVKDEASLRHKLQKQVLENKARPKDEREAPINENNVFERIVDLAGIRILHLHTEQMRYIHRLILNVLDEHRYVLRGNPTANCWDVEYETLFRDFGIPTVSRESMYTTVHYDVVANQKTMLTCELQVRSLMDEVWSEVSHRVNYPTESSSVLCRDQLKVLARLTTGGTRLVDSIFKAHGIVQNSRSA
ncbi:MAG: RelA/SpoT domain-containing protein [Gammaproteobacteria bacterium]|nr:RelA/SpoT domain-containing protein [Gammaproteobacteria bacterium]